MAIEIKDVEHLAELARITIGDKEKEVLRHDLEGILEYVSKVKEVVPKMSAPTAGKLRNVFREDKEPHEDRMFTEDLLKAAPTREGDRVFVKKIL
ncbi:MAG: Asp-tRNA(Asn)/Glu-tRNA(Gln) amidotransferase subunit GatC [Candidatus Pacebacteria bacterium]|nr:Asp-tRNA(Asn)/Glu-tRNA(Gln) amidotransferase subunit GatC [Candidatus Paceibacterota bacterium]